MTQLARLALVALVAPTAVACLVVAACSDRKPDDGPMVAPRLSADGKIVVPEGHETTYLFGETPVRLHYTWLDVSTIVNGRPSLRIHAQHGRMGMLTMSAPIPEGTAQLAHLKGQTVGAYQPGGVSFGNAPTMATGDGATITIDDVTSTYVTGHFESQACPFNVARCDRPTPVRQGKFKAFRSPLSDDAAFARVMKQP